MGKVRGAVEGIDDPAKFRSLLFAQPLLRDKVVIGKTLG
jgi:hypothetical protein